MVVVKNSLNVKKASLKPDFVRKIKDMGYAIKLDTNGTFPEKLEHGWKMVRVEGRGKGALVFLTGTGKEFASFLD